MDSVIEDPTSSVLGLCLTVGKIDMVLCVCVRARMCVYWYQMWIVDTLCNDKMRKWSW
jgi:hypothetical protein